MDVLSRYRSGQSRPHTLLGAMVTLCALASVTLAQAAPAAPAGSRTAPACAQVALAGVVGGNWEIVVIDLMTNRLLNLTQSLEDEHAPAWAPDGRALAFAARRAANWDVYILKLADGRLRRMTDSPAYDGYPSWSPDSAQIAFESSRDGNLEIYTIPAQGGAATRVTDDPAADVEPIWSADGEGLILGSWRSGARQLYAFDLATHTSTPLTAPGEEARQPALSPDGRRLAYVSTRDTTSRLLIRDLPGGSVEEVPSDEQGEWPAWQPSASATAPTSEPSLLMLELTGGSPRQYPVGWRLVAHRPAQAATRTDSYLPGLPRMLPGQWQRPACAPAGAPQAQGNWQPVAAVTRAAAPGSLRGLATLPNVRALQPRLAADVAESFQRLRQQTLGASGYDFLGVLNDAWRGLDHPHGAYLSWHKAGRAFDVRDWYAPDGRRSLFVTRQQLGEQTYFRIYLRAARQDGSQGTPLREGLWETEGRLSNPAWARAGGRALPPPAGYFVDFTDLAEREGWMRIPALTPPDGDWRRNYLDLEFWHYERRDGLRWYAAMQRIYDDDQLRTRFAPVLVLARGYTIEELVQAGMPGIMLDVLRPAIASDSHVE